MKKLYNKYAEYFKKYNINPYFGHFIAYDFEAINKKMGN